MEILFIVPRLNGSGHSSMEMLISRTVPGATLMATLSQTYVILSTTNVLRCQLLSVEALTYWN